MKKSRRSSPRRHGGIHGSFLLVCWAVFLTDNSLSAADEPPAPRQSIVVAIGAGGDESFAKEFSAWGQDWRKAAEKANAELEVFGLDEPQSASDREKLLQAVQDRAAKEQLEPLWIVLLGHGTFDGRVAKFNLRGPDISGADLAKSLHEAKRPVVIINCSSSSGPFVNELSGKNRVIVTATKSGNELNYARFGGYFAAVIGDPAADLDKDDQVSVLEAFVASAGRVKQFYEGENRLATEHALLDDNGDQLGTPAEWFRGTRAISAPRNGAKSTAFARIRCTSFAPSVKLTFHPSIAPHDALETQLEALRQKKKELPEADYYAQLEQILVELARCMRSSRRVRDGFPTRPTLGFPV